jgi:hypothetical protein
VLLEPVISTAGTAEIAGTGAAALVPGTGVVQIGAPGGLAAGGIAAGDVPGGDVLAQPGRGPVAIGGGSGPPAACGAIRVSWLMVRVMRPTSPAPDGGPGPARVRRRIRVTVMACPAGLVTMMRHCAAGPVSAASASWRAW